MHLVLLGIADMLVCLTNYAINRLSQSQF